MIQWFNNSKKTGYMKLTYIFHSGFIIEGKGFTLIMDYFRDSYDCFVESHLMSFKGPIYVLASHGHIDHYSQDVHKWKKQRPDVHYIFSMDVRRTRQSARVSDATFLIKGDTWQDKKIFIRTFGSTDVGVSFLIEAEGKRIFHAGDLNNWHWNEASTPEEVEAQERHYLKELADLREATDWLDVAMFPVDPRLGKDYMRGAEQFVDTIRVGLFSPMHFYPNYKKAEAFRACAERAGCRFAGWTDTGESMEF
jgi:L-ascorbate metabolism protein UlaG (beta-lactamase superfamily)